MANVIVYSTHTCPWCMKVKEFLTARKIKYTEKYVDDNRAAGEEMINKSNQRGVPVIDIDGTIVIGFDRNKLMELLELED